MTEPAVEIPRETLAVTLFGTPTLAARAARGLIYLAVRDLCATVGLNRASQMRRLRADEDLRDLRAYDDAITGIAERQRALEES